MIYGTMTVPRVVEESTCRSCISEKFEIVGYHKIHSTTLMPNIPFGSPLSTPELIDSSVFINDDSCKLSFPTMINCQNYITTKYVGIIPFEDYSSGKNTPAGTKFTLMCRNGNPNEAYSVFGTTDGVHGYGATDNVRTTSDGLSPKLATYEASRKFLRGDGTWVIPKEHELDP